MKMIVFSHRGEIGPLCFAGSKVNPARIIKRAERDGLFDGDRGDVVEVELTDAQWSALKGHVRTVDRDDIEDSLYY